MVAGIVMSTVTYPRKNDTNNNMTCKTEFMVNQSCSCITEDCRPEYPAAAADPHPCENDGIIGGRECDGNKVVGE